MIAAEAAPGHAWAISRRTLHRVGPIPTVRFASLGPGAERHRLTSSPASRTIIVFRALLIALLTALGLACQDGAAVPRVVAGPQTASPPFPWASPASVDLDEPALANLGDSVEAWVAAGYVAGAELLIIKDGRTVLHEAVGWRDLESGSPLQLNSIYRIRSMTKPLIGTAILMLQDEGRLSVDDRVSDHLPGFDMPWPSRSRER